MLETAARIGPPTLVRMEGARPQPTGPQPRAGHSRRPQDGLATCAFVNRSGFALAALTGVLLSLEYRRIGFEDSPPTPSAHEALVVEPVAALVLGAAAVLCPFRSAPRTRAGCSAAGAAM